jgi:predicted phosphodiesterase/GTPase SAR1 family protein
MKIAHISDIHHVQQNDTEHYKRLINILESSKIDVIVLSGDLCEKAGIEFGNPGASLQSLNEKFLFPAIAALNIPPENVIICPGNHDIDRKAIGALTWASISQSGLSDYKFALSVIPEISARWMDFNHTLKSWYDNSANVSLGELVHAINVTHKQTTFSFVIVNSVWFSNTCTAHAGDIIFPLDEMKKVIGALPVNSKKILITHAKFQDAAPKQAAEVEDLIFRSFEFVFSGHYHEPKPQIIKQHNGMIYSSQARKFGERLSEAFSIRNANGFAILEITEGSAPSLIGYRETINGDFVQDVDYFPNAFSIIDVNSLNLSLSQKLEEYRNQITTTELEEFDRNLLSHSLQTSAPKELAKIFVMPPITKRDNSGPGGEYRETLVDVNSFAKYKGKVCILGKKEAGKTTLLHKILLEAISSYGRTAVKLSFSEIIGKNKLKQSIARRIGIKERDVEKLLSDDNFLLLIDDFDFSKLSELKDTRDQLNECKNVIACQTCETVGVVSNELLSALDASQFVHLFIEDLKSKHIRELCSKWFAEDKQLARAKVEILVNSFLTIGLSCNPLSVSIFLWIMEKQQGKAPINKFTLIDQFVEKTFSKHDYSELQTSSFDYRNKTRVLASIAKKMLDEDREGYSLRRLDVISVIESYLSINALKFDAIDIFNQFVAVGILHQSHSEAEQCIIAKFRFSCLFTYYLMCEMGFDNNFLLLATSKDRYLEFVDEIEMLSGKM